MSMQDARMIGTPILAQPTGLARLAKMAFDGADLSLLWDELSVRALALTPDAGALMDEFGDVAFAPAGILDVIAQLLRNDDGVIAAIDRIVALVGAHLGGKGFQYLARVLGPFVHDLARRHGAHHGDGGDAFGDTAHHRQRLPGGVLFILGDAVGEFAGMAER